MMYYGASGAIINSQISDNTAGDRGGALHCQSVPGDSRNPEGSPVSLQIVESTVVGNNANLGGGVYLDDASPAMSGVTFSYNVAESSGGAVRAIRGATPFLEFCTFDHNQANLGGGLALKDATGGTFRACDFSYNRAWSQGGAVHIGEDARPIFEDTRVRNNESDHRGGGVYCDGGSAPDFRDCSFENNQATNDGGAAYSTGGSAPSFIRSVLSENSAEKYDGGGIFVQGPPFRGGGWPTLTNCILSNNYAQGNGGAVECYNAGQISMKHCTVSQNSAGSDGGAVAAYDRASVIIDQSILWTNSPQEIHGAGVKVSYSDVEGGYEGTGNISAAPKFSSYRGSAGSFDYVLRAGSPCIDSAHGEEDAIDWASVSARYGAANSSAPDMGAYGGSENAGWLE